MSNHLINAKTLCNTFAHFERILHPKGPHHLRSTRIFRGI